jgi:hypothetical protein
MQALGWTQQVLKLVRQLLDRLSKLIETMDKFLSHDGDVGYLLSLCDNKTEAERASARISEVSETLVALKFQRMKLLRHEKICEESANNVRGHVPFLS